MSRSDDDRDKALAHAQIVLAMSPEPPIARLVLRYVRAIRRALGTGPATSIAWWAATTRSDAARSALAATRAALRDRPRGAQKMRPVVTAYRALSTALRASRQVVSERQTAFDWSSA
jgi:hypothetical protein